MLLNVAVKDSLDTARRQRAGASNAEAGSSKSKGQSAAAALRAAAAERRLNASRGKKDVDVDDYLDDSESEPASSVESDDSDRPIAKGKAKAKATKAKSAKARNTRKPAVRTLADVRQETLDKKLAARLRRKEERQMRIKLGRKLTQVCRRPAGERHSFAHAANLPRPRRILLLLSAIIPSSRMFGETSNVTFPSPSQSRYPSRQV